MYNVCLNGSSVNVNTRLVHVLQSAVQTPWESENVDQKCRHLQQGLPLHTRQSGVSVFSSVGKENMEKCVLLALFDEVILLLSDIRGKGDKRQCWNKYNVFLRGGGS